MKYFLFLIFLTGCMSSPPLVVYEEVNICRNNTVVLNETVYLPCENDTVTDCKYEDVYVLDLIRRIKFLENRYDDTLNLSLEYDMEECQRELSECNSTLEELRDLLD